VLCGRNRPNLRIGGVADLGEYAWELGSSLPGGGRTMWSSSPSRKTPRSSSPSTGRVSAAEAGGDRARRTERGAHGGGALHRWHPREHNGSDGRARKASGLQAEPRGPRRPPGLRLRSEPSRRFAPGAARGGDRRGRIHALVRGSTTSVAPPFTDQRALRARRPGCFVRRGRRQPAQQWRVARRAA
jgi:hypothetical protein